MPIFEYRCEACAHVFDHLARTRSDKPKACPACGARKLAKQFASFAAVSGGSAPGAMPSCADGACSPGPSCATGACPFA